ncbi:MAG: hypothetical protein JWN57_2295, partial [Frankiales bacterium]|nr:hypothetical protein [Frankiales bacterium]
MAAASYLGQNFHTHQREIGLPYLPLHGPRHTYARLELETGVNAKVLSNRRGFAGIAITGTCLPMSCPRSNGSPPSAWARWSCRNSGQVSAYVS